MELEFITVGKIVNTHGIRGEVKLLPQGTEAETVARCRTLYIDGQPHIPAACRVHKGCLLIKLSGVDDMDAALALKHKAVAIRRSDPELPEGDFFDGELVGPTSRDAAAGRVLGTVGG